MSMSLITPMYPRDEESVGGEKEDDGFPWSTALLDQGANTATFHNDIPSSGGVASSAGGHNRHHHHHHHHRSKTPSSAASPPAHGYESEQDAFRTNLLVSLTKPRDDYEEDVKPTKILTKKDMAGLLHRKADEWASEQARILSAKYVTRYILRFTLLIIIRYTLLIIITFSYIPTVPLGHEQARTLSAACRTLLLLTSFEHTHKPTHSPTL